MMFSDDEIKEMPGGSFMRPGDEIISIRKVCLSDKYDKSDSSYSKEPFISNSGSNELDVSRSLFRDGFFPDTLEHTQARFAWTEEDGNIASLVSEPGFGSAQTFGKDLDAALSNEQEADTSSSVFNSRYLPKPTTDSHLVSSTSAAPNERRGTQGACKVDKTDPRSRFHYVKYVKRHGRTVKLWECGICSREFQHQYTLMRHLPTHTDERNFHCDTCGKSFRQLSTLSQHRAIHSAERPYGCEVCNKTFNRVSTLISHRKTHSDVKPYKCHLCPKGFHQKGNLRNHLFTHTNERPYRCNICFKGFNQQSNLVCHKNKAHSEDANGAVLRSRINTPRAASAVSETQPDSTRTSVDQCEVSSSVGPYMSTSIEVLSSSSWTPKSSPSIESGDNWSNDLPWSTMCNGVIVDPIKTYHMGVALATRQTPFALLKPDNSTPVLVKVIDTKIPGGKQMLVPATADDLRIGGKIVVNNSENNLSQDQRSSDLKGAVQIRVPVVATVVPQIKAGGQLHLAVQEPHHAYHTALSDVTEMNDKPCTMKEEIPPSPPRLLPRMERMEPRMERMASCMPSNLPPLERHITTRSFDDVVKPGTSISSSCSLPPPAPSPPLDLITDLFEPMECIPLGPQITAVDNIDQPPHSDDSDIFIGEFEESIPLSDSD